MLRLYDTLSREVRELRPLESGTLSMYSCGPTVYRSVHIGNLRTYLLADWIKRTALARGLSVRHVKNITDVGHMRQELAERGGDKVIAAALAAGRTPAEIAAEFEGQFRQSEALLDILPADVFPRATEHVAQMIDLVRRLLERGLAYRVGGTVYFDTAAAPGYGSLSGNSPESLESAVAAEPDPQKRHAGDFTLWREAEPGRRLMVWDSPFGRGYPGWHIECSAMAMAYLGEEFDLHTGGVDNIFPHHEDERAQSEGATGRTFARHWAHGQHLLADGVKMAKSQGNVYTIQELEERGFDPMAFRYLCATVHYRSRLNFTLASLAGAQKALQRLRLLAAEAGGTVDQERVGELGASLLEAMEEQLNLPRAVALLWDFARAPVSKSTRRQGLLATDPLLGLGLRLPGRRDAGPGPWRDAAQSRELARAERAYPVADQLRVALLDQEVVPEDGRDSTRYRRATALDHRRGLISSPAQIPDRREAPDACEVSVSIVSAGYPQDLERCLQSLLSNRKGHAIEILVVDNGAGGEVSALLQRLSAEESCIKPFHADHQLGEAAARNVTLRAATGRVILVLDTGVEAVGDCFGPILAGLEDEAVGAVGRWGARSSDLREFEDSQEIEVDAIDGYCLAFRRARLRQVGLMDERFRFYRMLDFNFGMGLRAQGLSLRRIPDLPVVMHRHRGWEDADEEERERLSRLNFRRFFDQWHHRQDLLVGGQASGD